MGKIAVFKISDGYELKERKQTMKTDKAVNFLLSRKCREYSKAINNLNGSSELFYNVIRCPFCNCEVTVKKIDDDSEFIDRDSVAQWASGQLSLTKEEKTELIFNKNEVYPDVFSCPSCKKKSERAQKYYNFIISLCKNEIRVALEISELCEFLKIKWTDKIKLDMTKKTYESIVFNLGKGKAYIQLENGEKIVCRKDLTQCPQILKETVIYNLIKTNHKLKREIKNVFKEKGDFPFELKEVSPENLILFTRFQGYNRLFYYSIPFFPDSFRLFPGFKSIAKKMHKADKIPALYKELNLPKNKSTKKIIMNNIGVIFYYDTINKLYEVVDNVDYFNRIISSWNIYTILAQINSFPVLIDFLKDAFRYAGNKGIIVDDLIQRLDFMIHYGRKYMALRDDLKKYERNRIGWLTSAQICDSYAKYKDILPDAIRNLPHKDINCIIDGYEFEWLITSMDYVKAGRMMKNCLGYVNEPVIVIKKELEYVAALSLDTEDNLITEALESHNASIEENSSLYNAIEKWRTKFNFSYQKDF